MSHEERPEFYNPPQEYCFSEREGLFIHTLGRVGLSNEMGPGGSSSYHVTYFEDEVDVYVKPGDKNTNTPPQSFAVPTSSKYEPEGYDKTGTYHGSWVKAYAAGKKISEIFVKLDGPAKAESYLKTLGRELNEANGRVRHEMYVDLKLLEEQNAA